MNEPPRMTGARLEYLRTHPPRPPSVLKQRPPSEVAKERIRRGDARIAKIDRSKVAPEG